MIHHTYQLHEIIRNVVLAFSIGGLGGIAFYVSVAALVPILVRAKRRK